MITPAVDIAMYRAGLAGLAAAKAGTIAHDAYSNEHPSTDAAIRNAMIASIEAAAAYADAYKIVLSEANAPKEEA